jgi:streptogramin lyase
MLASLCLVCGGAWPQVVTEFSAGITPGARPLGIVTGPDGNLWFTESGLDRIGRITPAGVVTEFSVGITPGSQPSEITIGADGNLWFTEQGGGRIGRITPNGLVTEFESAVANGIAGGSDGSVWFTNRARGFVSRITPAGIVTQFGPFSNSNTGQITAGSDGSLWLTATSVIGLPLPLGPTFYFDILGIDSNGQNRFKERGSLAAEPPSGVTQGPDGNVWYMLHYSGGSLSIVRWTLDSPRVRTSYPTNSSGPQGDGGIARGPDGNLWFTNQAALPLRGVQVFRDSIGRITPSGVVTNFAFGSSGKPADITAAPDGNVWFTYVDGSRIGRITPGGKQTDFSAGFDPDQFAIAIAPGADGNLWFTLSEGSSPGAYVGRITPTGEIKTFKIAPDFISFDDIAVGPDNSAWLTDPGANAIKRITPAGEVTNFNAGMTAGARPSGIARGADGNLWFTEPGIDRVARITTAGVITEYSAGIRAGARPGAITAGADGNLWFIETADSAGNGAAIGRITPSGVVTEFTSPFGIPDRWQPIAITSGIDGDVWFTERLIVSGVANGPAE